MAALLRTTLLACLLAGAGGGAWSQGGIYTCVDAKGRRLTYDRPIAECLDREQKELNPNGTVRRTIGPSLTQPERAALQEQERKAAEELSRQAEERRMLRALLARYPTQAVHDGERAKALQSAEDTILASQRRIADLRLERKKLDTETEFYKTPAQWPVKLKRQVEELEHQIEGHQRLVTSLEEEKKRVERRFDEELWRLRTLWAQAQPTRAAAAPDTAAVRR